MERKRIVIPYEIKLIKASMLLALWVMCSSCGTPHATMRAVADYHKALGLVQSEIELAGKKERVWQFLLCDRAALFHADNVEALLTNSEICYNPFVDADGDAAVYFTQPEAEAARTKATLRWVGKGVIVAGGTVLAFASVKFGIKAWKLFTGLEQFVKYSLRMAREKIAKSSSRKDRLLAWVTGGGAVGFFASWFLVGDGAWKALAQVWGINKTYFNKAKKVVLEWGLPEQTYLDNYPYLVNDAWHDTRKMDAIDRLLLGIKNTLQCEFSPRYIEENPLRAPPSD